MGTDLGTTASRSLEGRLQAQAIDYETTDDDVRVRFRDAVLDPWPAQPGLGPQPPFGTPR